METIETLGKYEIKRLLGRGAMGTVYEGWDPIIARRVAIKTVRLPDASDPETEEALARFRREAQAAGRLNHPNIVGVFDYGETNDLAYIVMEFVDGPPLKSLLDKQERFALADTVRIMEDLLAGLHYSHERGVVHRDIKPANVMLTGTGQAKIADFGIARIESSSMTQAGTVTGNAGLHVARAVHGPGGGRAHRHLFVGRAAVSAADRRASVRRRHVGDHAQGAEHRSAVAVAALGDRAAVVRRRGAPGDGKAAGGPLPVCNGLRRGDTRRVVGQGRTREPRTRQRISAWRRAPRPGHRASPARSGIPLRCRSWLRVRSCCLRFWAALDGGFSRVRQRGFKRRSRTTTTHLAALRVRQRRYLNPRPAAAARCILRKPDRTPPRFCLQRHRHRPDAPPRAVRHHRAG